MKKLLAAVMAVILVLALSSAYAVQMPTISITATPIDYVYALAGIAQPVSKTYTANERYAVLVTVTVPTYMDTTGMQAIIAPAGCSVETGDVPIRTGSYILTGTVIGNASITITLQDNNILSAGTAQELWSALYGDRSVSTTVRLGAAQSTISTGGVAAIPQTGEPGLAALCVVFVGAVGLWAHDAIKQRRAKK